MFTVGLAFVKVCASVIRDTSVGVARLRTVRNIHLRVPLTFFVVLLFQMLMMADSTETVSEREIGFCFLIDIFG